MRTALAILGVLWGAASAYAAEPQKSANSKIAPTPEWFSTYRVTGVASSDVLNIGKEAGGEVMGSFPFDAKGIVAEGSYVLEDDGSVWWGVLGPGAERGVVNSKFLVLDTSLNSEIPEIISCFGSEPFWNLEISGSSATYDELRFHVIGKAPPEGWQNPFHYSLKSDSGQEAHAIVSTEEKECNDGMADVYFISSIFLLTPEKSLRIGCCHR